MNHYSVFGHHYLSGNKCSIRVQGHSSLEGATSFHFKSVTFFEAHIDRFNSLEAAMKVAGRNGVAAQAHGSFWLMTVEAKTEDHHGGHHVALIGPLMLPTLNGHSMRVQSSLIMSWASTPAHTHPGPEAIYCRWGTMPGDAGDRGTS